MNDQLITVAEWLNSPQLGPSPRSEIANLCCAMSGLNLYLLSNNTVRGYDTYDSCVVAAENEVDARNISPNTRLSVYNRMWCRPEDVIVEYIGKADPNIESGIIISSFNAG